MMWTLHGPAQSATPSEISEHFKNSRWELPWELLVIGLGLVLIVLVVWSLLRWWKTRDSNPSPLVLYSIIARRAGLTWADRLLLWRIARARKLSSPISLLLARGALEKHSRAYRQRLGAGTSRRVQRRVERLSADLFGPAR